MATERWLRVQEGQLQLVEEVDGPAFLRAQRPGPPSRWVTPTTLETLTRQYGADSPLVQEARALLAQAPRTP
jgi:hypothetical protein